MDWLAYVAIAANLAWMYLLLLHWGFWRSDQFLPTVKGKVTHWPSVVAVIPARNEADVIARTLKSVASQDYPGKFSVILVNDSSTDKTESEAKAVKGPVRVINAPALDDGWAGKLWALNTGVNKAPEGTDFYWFTDADIEHEPHVLKGLVKAAKLGKRDLVSQMVKLHCGSLVERAFVPAFIFFFQMLYPFRAANSQKSGYAAAAGGCVLIHRFCLEKIGGLEAMKDALIDDCTLAKKVKTNRGRIWIGLGPDSRSVRPYTFKDFWMTVVRTAYTQLKLSPILLVGTVIGMALVFLGPPALVWLGILGNEPYLWGAGAAAWLVMVVLYQPTLRLYGLSPLWGIFLPVIALLYQVMTIHSAIRHWLGRGGHWKGRSYDFGEK